ncbi:MAG: hypothetical protein ACREXX_23805 [Gammaproteobacteria bacterium]
MITKVLNTAQKLIETFGSLPETEQHEVLAHEAPEVPDPGPRKGLEE